MPGCVRRWKFPFSSRRIPENMVHTGKADDLPSEGNAAGGDPVRAPWNVVASRFPGAFQHFSTSSSFLEMQYERRCLRMGLVGEIFRVIPVSAKSSPNVCRSPCPPSSYGFASLASSFRPFQSTLFLRFNFAYFVPCPFFPPLRRPPQQRLRSP
jgi:hypothetical protein